HRQRASVTFYCSRDIRQSFKLGVIPQPGKPHRGVDGVLVDEVTAENDHSQTGLGSFLVISDRLFSEDSLVGRANPRRTHRSERDTIRKGGVSDPQRCKQMGIAIDTHSQSLDAAIVARWPGAGLCPSVFVSFSRQTPSAGFHALVPPVR